MWEYRAYASGPEAVHDGDTVKLTIDQGFDERTEKWIRLASVRAPETGTAGADQARLFVQDWLAREEKRAPARRWRLRVITDTTKRKLEPTQITTLERYVATIFSIATGECLNEAVIRYIAEHPDWPPGRDPYGL